MRTLLLALCLATRLVAAPVEGRYVVFGNALGPNLGIAEIEVWSGDTNVVANHPEYWTLNGVSMHDNVESCFRNLVNGRTNVYEKWAQTLEITSKGAGGYMDGFFSCISIEADLGTTVPVDRIDYYRSRYLLNGQHYKLSQDPGWRYLLVLDEHRRIVSWQVFDRYGKDWLTNEGHWTFTMAPATGAPAGRVVPAGSRSWLSEAEFIRDFLGKPVVDRTVPPDDAARARLAHFQRRNDPAEIRRLGEAFFRVVDLDRPGLAAVKALVDKQDYAAAFEAFKAPFFQTIGILDPFYTSPEYVWECDTDSRSGARARDLMNNVYADKKDLSVVEFTPGLLPPSPLEWPFQMRPLLLTYVATGDTRALRTWEAMTDDWALGYQQAADNDPALREHFVLISGPICLNLLDLLNAGKDNPEFVRDLSGATLARFLMPILEEMPVAIWRVCRTCVFNHTYNAMHGGTLTAMALADFRAGQRLAKEMRQQVVRIHTLAQYRDGPMVEEGDEGHFSVAYNAPARLYGKFAAIRPDWFTPALQAQFLDGTRQNELFCVRHTAPDGRGIRWEWRTDLRHPGLNETRWDGPRADTDWAYAAYLQKLAVMLEPGCRAVVDTVYGPRVDLSGRPSRVDQVIAATYHRPPSFVSDWLPYAGAWYFRGGWDREASMLHMLKPTIANNAGGGFYNPFLKAYERFETTSYRFTDYATPLFTMFAAEIDRQRPCPQDGRYPSGSKQEVFSRAVEKPQTGRWFTDARLDFGETTYVGAYHNVYRYRTTEPREIITYEDDPARIDGVRTTRQIVQVRPARLFLHIERIRYADPAETHTNRLPATFILTEPGPDTGKEYSPEQMQVDAKANTVLSRNPGNPGVTVTWFGQPDLAFKPYSVAHSIVNFWPQPDPEVVNPEQDGKLVCDNWGNGTDTLNGPRQTTGRGVFASWPAQGESVILAALYANRPDEEPVTTREDISTDSVAGLRLRTKDGVVVRLLVARRIPAALEIDAVAVEGEALLLVEVPKQPPTAMVLGATRVTVDGVPVALDGPDQVFALDRGTGAPLRRPLDPPTVKPGVATFSGKLTVSLETASPDAVIRYTTAVPPSRLDDFLRLGQKVVDGELTVIEAAERLVIEEEPGEQWQVYTGPFEIAADTFIRARTCRRGVATVRALPAAGDDFSAVSYAFFRRRDVQPATHKWPWQVTPGLAYDYLEDRWFALWTYADVLPATATGTTDRLLDVSMRATDGPFAVRYNGYLAVPRTGLYTFYAPTPYIDNTVAPGYDVRVYVDGEEWDLEQGWHARGTWSIPLAKGLHRFMVTFADARAKDLENQRSGLWSHYPHPRTTWRGVAPVLEMSGPGLDRQPIPNAWLKR